jgi:fibronectin-binding autotransporter adhesin
MVNSHCLLHRAALRAACCLLPLTCALPAWADIIVGGDPGQVTPLDIASWTSSTNGIIGRDLGQSGSLTINANTSLSSSSVSIGLDTGSTGTATVTGANSTWTNSSTLYIGNSGNGTLTIENGGKVSNAFGYIGFISGSTGAVTVAGTNSTWTNSGALYVGKSGTGTLTVNNGGVVTAQSLYANFANLYGNGTINVQGLVADTDLVFDTTHGLVQTLTFGTGGSLNLDLSAGTGDLGVGYRGVGTLRIAEGRTVQSVVGFIGYSSGSSGTATVTGANSTWTNSGNLYVGRAGNGTLTIENGGKVSNSLGSIGNSSGVIGSVTVTGTNSTWTNSGALYVGNTGTGTLLIENGGKVSNTTGSIGNSSGVIGSVTVTGANSTWINTSTLLVGISSGTGTLTVNNGGVVTAQSLYANFADLYGNGTINVRGLVADTDLVLDATNGLVQTLTFGTGGSLNLDLSAGTGDLGVGHRGVGTLRIAEGRTVQSAAGNIGYSSGSSGTATVTGANSIWTNTSTLNVGRSGNGTLTIENGGKISNTTGYIGYSSGSISTVTVTGTNSTWTNGSSLYVGNSGTGTLLIENGGKVSNTTGYMGYNSGSISTVTVAGTNSTWTNSSSLYVGRSGNGTLTIENGGKVSNTTGYIGNSSSSIGTVTVMGTNSIWVNSANLNVGSSGNGALTIAYDGKVTANAVTINTTSSVHLNVSRDGMLVLGSGASNGSMTNNGTVKLYADAFATAGVYTPITPYTGKSITWSGTGTYQAFGGVWNNTAKTFTTTTPLTAITGATATVNTGDRLIITDPATGKRVGASFGTISGPDHAFSASRMGDTQIDGHWVLAAWDFTSTLSSVFLTFDVGIGYDLADLQAWHYTGGSWQPYGVVNLTYDRLSGIASFTADSFSGYALTGVTPIPEPAHLGLFSLITGVLLYRRRRAR